MAFDVNTAQPVSGFDMSTAKDSTEDDKPKTVRDIYESYRNPVEKYVPDVALEAGSSLARGATDVVDFWTTDPVNSAISNIVSPAWEAVGGDKITARMPSVSDIPFIKGGTVGGFMDDGTAKDVVRSLDIVPSAVAGGGVLRAGAKTIPKVADMGESVATGVMRQMGKTTAGADVAYGSLSGGGRELGGATGEVIAGDEGRVIGEQIGSLVLPVGASIAKETMGHLVTGSAKKLLQESAPTIDSLKDSARKIYKEIDNLGAVVHSSKTDRLGSNIKSMLKKEGYDTDLHPKVGALINRFTGNEGRDLTVSEIDTIRKIAQASAGSIDKSEKRLGVMVIKQIDDFLDNLSTKDFKTGGGEVGALFKDARQLWARASKSGVIEEAFTKAHLQASGFENGLRIQMRQMLNNKKVRSMFNEEEIKAMKKVIQGGSAENLAKMIGKFGFSEGQASNMMLGSLGMAGGYGMSGITGAIAVPLIGQMSKGLAQKMTKGNAEFADAVIRAGKDGTKLVSTYMKYVPKNERSASELSELLIRPSVSLEKLKAKQLLSLSKEQKKLIDDAVYYTGLINANESGQPSN